MTALPALLKLLTSRAALSLPQAMKAARSLMPHGHATADALSQLSLDDLQALGVDDSEAKKIASAFGSAGKAKGKQAVKRKVGGDSGGVGAGPSSSTAVKKQKKEYQDPFEIPLQDGPRAGEKLYPALNYGLNLTEAVRPLPHSATSLAHGSLKPSSLDSLDRTFSTTKSRLTEHLS